MDTTKLAYFLALKTAYIGGFGLNTENLKFQDLLVKNPKRILYFKPNQKYLKKHFENVNISNIEGYLTIEKPIPNQNISLSKTEEMFLKNLYEKEIIDWMDIFHFQKVFSIVMQINQISEKSENFRFNFSFALNLILPL